MTTLLQHTPSLLAIGLAGLLAACGNASESESAASAAKQGQVVANDCRSPDAQSTQRGCRPLARMLGKL